MSSARVLSAVLIAGWLAEALASKDADVEAGIAAYEAGDYEEALLRFDAARERRPERSELSFDRGLVLLAQQDVEAARTAFETASEADDSDVRASAFYELGNIALDAEEFDVAIEAYIESLKARPDHANAKWNLELALSLEQQQQQEQEQDEEEEQEQDEDEQEQDEDEQNEDEQEQDEQEPDEQEQDEQEPDEQEQDEQEQDEQEPDEQEPDEQEPDEQEPDEQDPKDPQTQPQAIDEMDVDKALEQLDEQDPFTLDRPAGGYVQPQKDW